jgi:hypothetical protein
VLLLLLDINIDINCSTSTAKACAHGEQESIEDKHWQCADHVPLSGQGEAPAAVCQHAVR